MPGGLDPFPRRCGGVRGRTIETITNSLVMQRGTAYSTSPNSNVWLQSTALARALAAAWETNARLANQFDPYRVTDFLVRWEDIYGITPAPGSTPSQRRAAVAARWILAGKPATTHGVADLVRTLLPNTFVALHFMPSAKAFDVAPVDVIPGTGGQPLGGVTIAGTGAGPGHWGSTIHHLAIEVSQPSWMPDEDYYREVRAVGNGILDSFLPSWVTYSAYRTSPFRLDSTANLDNAALSDVSLGTVIPGGTAWTQPIFPVYFSRDVRGFTGNAPTYCNYYGFNVASPTALTITLSTGTAPSTYGILRSGPDTLGAIVANFASTYSATLSGDYTLEVSTGAADTTGLSPGTVTIHIT